MKYYDCLYLDKEKDIKIEFYKEKNSYYYVLRTPNYPTGNLISNLAKVCDKETELDENGLKIIKGKIPSFINEENKRIFILKFNNKTVAVINDSGKIMQRAEIPAISKTFMSQTKDYKLSLNKTLIRTYIEEEYKLNSDIHTHMNACLSPDVLIALGISRQIKYPYYYVKKLKLNLTSKQETFLEKQRQKVSKKFLDSDLVGKYKERRIDDNTYINFAELILGNISNAQSNIEKIRSSLAILKDGQAVFTNLEKLYLYRRVFTMGEDCKCKIKYKNINKIPDEDIKSYLKQMLLDKKNENYKNNSILEDKLLWIGRSYAKQSIKYIEISNTSLVKNNNEPFDILTKAHRILPIIEKETGVKIRFLAALRRIPLTIIKDYVTPENYLRENLDVLKAVGLDPYVVGCDFVGEEINDIRELKPVIKEIVEFTKDHPDFTIRIHAGENDSLKNNVSDSIKCVKESMEKGQKHPVLRLGHSLYTPNLNTTKGKNLLKEIKDSKVILEFQITSNVRLNNLIDLDNHPLKTYLKNNIKCVVGSDGCGIYGTDILNEQLALINLLKLNKNEMKKMVEAEKFILDKANKTFIKKYRDFENLCNGRSIEETLKDEIKKNKEKSKALHLNLINKFSAEKVLGKQIKELPTNKYPIIIAGGSFNSENRNVKINLDEKKVIDKLLSKLNPNKVFFIIGHSLNGYEKYLFENKNKFEVYAIVPADISKSQKEKLLKFNIPLRISTEILGMGIYKSFNYEIFERRPSTVIAMDGNSAGANLIQEAKNGNKQQSNSSNATSSKCNSK